MRREAALEIKPAYPAGFRQRPLQAACDWENDNRGWWRHRVLWITALFFAIVLARLATL